MCINISTEKLRNCYKHYWKTLYIEVFFQISYLSLPQESGALQNVAKKRYSTDYRSTEENGKIRRVDPIDGERFFPVS